MEIMLIIINFLLCIGILIFLFEVFNRLRGNPKLSKLKTWKLKFIIKIIFTLATLLLLSNFVLFLL